MMGVLETGETMNLGEIDPARVPPETVEFLRQQYEKLGSRLREFEPRPIKVVPVCTEDAIRLWRDKRGDAQPDQGSIDKRRAKMRDFFAWVRGRHSVVDGDDLTQCTADDVQGYKEHLIETYGRQSNVPYDRMIDVLACFNVADENNKFRGLKDGNPATKVTTPPKRKGVPRPAFTDKQPTTLCSARTRAPTR
ncbi:MAG: hypothetical protein WB697_07830 [Stellaceae bacterium]